LSFDRVIGSPGSSIFKKIQNDVVLEKRKTKANGLQPSFWPGFAGSAHRVTPGHDFFYFSSTQPGSSPGSAGSRVDPPGRVSKLFKKSSFPTKTDLNHRQLLHHRGRLGEGGLWWSSLCSFWSLSRRLRVLIWLLVGNMVQYSQRYWKSRLYTVSCIIASSH